MRHLAWLNAAPDPAEGSKQKPQSRREILRPKRSDGTTGEPLAMPDVDAPYMLAYLQEIGPTVAAGMGEAPIPHSEIKAWQRNTGIQLSAWEVRTLRRLSLEYVTEYQRGRDPDAPAPWGDSPDATAAAIVAARLRRELRELASM